MDFIPPAGTKPGSRERDGGMEEERDGGERWRWRERWRRRRDGGGERWRERWRDLYKFMFMLRGELLSNVIQT